MGAGVATGPHCLDRASPCPKARTRPPSGFGRGVGAETPPPPGLPDRARTPWRFAAERGPKVPPDGERIRRLAGNSVRLRIRSAVPEGLGSRRKSSEGATAPSSRPSLAFRDDLPGGGRRFGSGLAGEASDVAVRCVPCRASAEAAASRVARAFTLATALAAASSAALALHASVPRDFDAPAVAGKASAPFPDRRLWPRRVCDSDSDSRKAPTACG